MRKEWIYIGDLASGGMPRFLFRDPLLQLYPRQESLALEDAVGKVKEGKNT